MPTPRLFKHDPTDQRCLILRNGTRLRRSYDDVDLYSSEHESIYSLTRYGLRPKKIQRIRKRNYGKKTRSGAHQGQRYPYVIFRDKKYEIHILVTLAWLRARGPGEEIDHINGDIDDCRLKNLRIISAEENDRCAGILRRLRNFAKKRKDPALDPLNIKQQDLIEIFDRLKGKILDIEFPKEVERYRTLVTLRRSAVLLHDPSLNPDNMDAERRELVLSKYRVEDPEKIIDDDFKHHREF